MSNGLSGCIQYPLHAKYDRLERIRQAKKEAFDNYINSYINCVSQKTCKCSVCKTENIHFIKVVRTSKGVEETWQCAQCGRIVERFVSNGEFSQWLNEDRRKTA